MSIAQRTILVVDDSEICRETVRYVLQSRGYEVVTVDSPFSFGSALSRSQPDLVLVDANMPALQGDKLVAVAIQNELCSCPIVFHSDRPVEELQALVKSSGASGYIQKTSNAEEFVMAVEDYLAGAKMRPESGRVSRDSGPVSQRFGAPSTRGDQSGVYPSGGPASTRLRGQKP
jgi:DNA-binding response OmpR family regulator